MIEISHLTKTYPMGDMKVRALQGVTLSIDAGDFVAIMGPSGSGKSTLMHLLGLLDTPTSGSYRLLGRETAGLREDALAELRGRTVGFIFQQFNLLARTSALDNVMLPLQYVPSAVAPAGRKPGPSVVNDAGSRLTIRRDDDRLRATELLKRVGLGSRLHHKPNELSGGQQQRVAIARAMVNQPAILFADEPTGNLDSTSEKEILALLQELNKEGVTIVMVTHEDEIAAVARRVIRMRDGVVVSDQRHGSEGHSPVVAPADRKPGPSVVNDAGSRLTIRRDDGLSNWLNTHRSWLSYFRSAFTALMANKVRSALSMLGILIGVGAVIAMLALGRGAKDAVEQQLSSLGSNLLILMSGGRRTGAVMLQQGSVTRFTPEDGQDILQSVSGVTAVNPTITGRGQVVYGNKNWNSQIVGVTPAYEALRGYSPEVGRFFTDTENRQRARVALLGAKPYQELFGGASAIGEYIKINRVPFQVIGVFPVKGASGWRDQDDLVVIPVDTAMRRLLGKTNVDYIDIQVTNRDEMDRVEKDVRQLMVRRLRLPPSQEDTLEVRNLADIQAAVSASSRIMSLLLSIVAAISLLVGGIGIMNIMLVSVTERTREIGLRKALGARRIDILAQFLIEALTTSFLGGVLGILIGASITVGLATFANWTVRVSLDAILISAGFSAAIGVLFGLWPARQAARLDPITALRYE